MNDSRSDLNCVDRSGDLQSAGEGRNYSATRCNGDRCAGGGLSAAHGDGVCAEVIRRRDRGGPVARSVGDISGDDRAVADRDRDRCVRAKPASSQVDAASRSHGARTGHSAAAVRRCGRDGRDGRGTENERSGACCEEKGLAEDVHLGPIRLFTDD